MNTFNKKVMTFATALKDMYLPEEERESFNIQPIELTSEDITEDFTCMLYAMFTFYMQVIEDDSMDIIGFTHLCNRLVIQRLQEKEKNE